MQETYLRHSAGLNVASRAMFKSLTPYIRQFDYAGAQRVTHFIANSRFVQQRIREHYGRESAVIHPPVSVSDFHWDRKAEDFYLVVSELVPYKRIDLAVDAFNRLGKKLVIIGAGSELAALQARAKSNITFLGRQPFSVLKDHYERCRAFIFPGIEDFGITPLEAQAAGRPVIAFGEGGALETVIAGVTGTFFDEQTANALADAVLVFEKNAAQFSPVACRENAERFSPQRFHAKVKQFLAAKLPDMFKNHVWPDEILSPCSSPRISDRMAA
jgi:glycosyltransferase involved in cell wall biosynthesis